MGVGVSLGDVLVTNSVDDAAGGVVFACPLIGCVSIA